ncbi:M56 family metallopeptidase [Pedobacter sp. Du54]|uniref:M56 family metallopeptidase n=1 Tax=Pedobacter anseongensis TaxID=3133439 RepID=UPI0030A5401B
MIPYSLHVALILAVCLVFYQLFLHKETYYQLNRVVLLTCLLLAFLLPLIPVPQHYSLRPQEEMANVNTLPIAEQTTALGVSESAISQRQTDLVPVHKIIVPEVPLTDRIIKWAFWVYWCGFVVLSINLLIQVLVLLYQAYRKPVIKDGIYRIVELDGNKAPCSFGNTIFINPTKYDWETYNQILIHEKVHVQQGHSFDLILAELVLVVQWFNPFAWLYRKALESNLEFLADDSVLHEYKVEMEGYQLSLLKVAVPNQSMNITTNYNQSLLKKRIVMMNAKKSNVHTMWKYFVLVPLMALLLCGLNKPVAMSSVPATESTLNVKDLMLISAAKGLWFATIKDDKVQVEFKSDEYIDRNYRWSNSATFNVSEFSALPSATKTDFTVTREAGTVTFTGKFDNDQGFGRFKFVPNKDFKAFLAFKGIDDMEDEEYVSFFMMDVKRQYVQFLNDNGFKNLSKSQIISMSAFKIDAEYIKYWRKLGYIDITASNLISLKSMKIDSIYVNDIRKAGYTDLTVQQLISFKAQKITGSYINSLQKATLKRPVPGSVETKQEKPTPSEIISAKAMKVDTNYMAAIRDAGFQDLNPRTIYTLKSQNISPEFIKSFQDIGMKNLTTSQLYTLKSQNITADLVKSYQDIGLANLTTSTIYAFKNQGITPEYIKSFQEIGLKDLPYTTFYTLKVQGLTPAYIKSFQDIGLKDIPFSTLYTLKSQGITPAYIKSFQEIGLKDVPFNTLYTFKSQGITPEFIKGFMALGYKNIPYNQYYSLKSQGITPEYVADMKQKGFDSKDVQKYIQLKSFNGAKNK